MWSGCSIGTIIDKLNTEVLLDRGSEEPHAHEATCSNPRAYGQSWKSTDSVAACTAIPHLGAEANEEASKYGSAPADLSQGFKFIECRRCSFNNWIVPSS